MNKDKHILYFRWFPNLRVPSLVVTVNTSWLNIQKSYLLPTECSYICVLFQSENKDYFLIQQ